MSTPEKIQQRVDDDLVATPSALSWLDVELDPEVAQPTRRAGARVEPEVSPEEAELFDAFRKALLGSSEGETRSRTRPAR